MKRRDLKKWEKMKSGGKKKFLVRYGIIGWGLPLGFIFPIINGFIKIFFDSETGLEYFLSLEFLFYEIVSLFIFAVGGLLYGLLFWKLAENSFKRYREEHMGSDER